MNEVKVSCRGFPATESIHAEAGRQAEKLFELCDRIRKIDVTIDLRHRSKRQGQIFHVQLELHLPGDHVFINREAEKDPAHEDLGVALRDAFLKARRRLEDELRIRRGFVKTHRAEEVSAVVL